MDKMKLGIFCNFTYPSIGGSEEVCKAIAERMFSQYGMEVSVYGYNVSKTLIHNGVIYKKCVRGPSFINQINEVDHAFIYSDSFWGFETILKNINSIKPSLSIALLGMYCMKEKPLLFNIFRKNSKRFNVITHSNCYQDYEECFKFKIPVTVIPNGVSQEEFLLSDETDVRKKYNIGDKKIILNVSNYFYGKGQEYLSDTASSLVEIRPKNDFIFVQLSSDIKYPHDKKFLNNARQRFDSLAVDSRFLRNVPREDVVSFFKQAYISLLTSLKEVSPIVLLESMAAKTPWISMDVGNSEALWGGAVLINRKHDEKGYKVFSSQTARGFASIANMYLDCPKYVERDGRSGLSLIGAIYNWDLICEKYYNIFIR